MKGLNMSKDTFYFSHDYNTRNDQKIKKLISKHGYLGYGLFWAIVEDLYNNANEIQLDYEMLSFELRSDIELIKSVINNFDLFVVNGNTFGSRSVERRLDYRDKKSKTAKDNARKRWGENEGRTKANECIFYVLRFCYESELFLKCGITSESISRRYSGKTNKYDYTILFQQEMSVTDALNLESLIHENCIKHTPLFKFGGFLECYNLSEESKILDFALQRECNGNAKNNFSNAIKEKKVKEIKEKEIKVNDIEERKLKFADTLKPYLEVYGRDTLLEFYEYWTEPNKSNTKFKQELQETWSVKRRLESWVKNDFSNKGKTISNGQPSKMESMVNSAKEALNMIYDEN
jgi:hypothetical protein